MNNIHNFDLRTFQEGAILKTRRKYSYKIKKTLKKPGARIWTWIIWFRIKSIENLFPFVPITALLLLNRVDGWTKLIAFKKQVYKFLISVSISYSDISHGFSRSAYKNTAVMSQNEISISRFLNFFPPFLVIT